MFKLDEIKELVHLLDETSIQELELEHEGSRILIRKPNKTETIMVPSAPVQHNYTAPAAAPHQPEIAHVQPVKEQVEDPSLHKIVSPMVGTFYQAPSPDKDSFVKLGAKVNETTTVCIVEAMKLMNEIEAEVKGEIVEILAENGQLVEYGQPLFIVKTM